MNFPGKQPLCQSREKCALFCSELEKLSPVWKSTACITIPLLAPGSPAQLSCLSLRVSSYGKAILRTCTNILISFSTLISKCPI